MTITDERSSRSGAPTTLVLDYHQAAGAFDGGAVRRYLVVIEQGPTSYSAYVPDLPGCVSVGKTVDEVTEMIREAIEFHLEGRRLAGEPIPEPTSRMAYVEV
jgi:predicted RNase H-like HicB family nuclease